MIFNSDERQWAWFDEGIKVLCNSLLSRVGQQLSILCRSGTYHSRLYERPKDQLEPIKTNSENIIDYGNMHMTSLLLPSISLERQSWAVKLSIMPLKNIAEDGHSNIRHLKTFRTWRSQRYGSELVLERMV
ncbi:MAG: hypothetical protein IPP49_10705 [Saprospiraceae bacterium]|nr:hypothetical protein [Saprospiraceae bacterium]